MPNFQEATQSATQEKLWIFFLLIHDDIFSHFYDKCVVAFNDIPPTWEQFWRKCFNFFLLFVL